ncbi:hypothetical protein QQF64_035986 [Cirrhinus molitorella]|uniref:Uncharacterized protein n=1 Tax=Cirrhinus molitorella TaxID=172907 RepID=A0ABR3NHB0_9TELE
MQCLRLTETRSILRTCLASKRFDQKQVVWCRAQKDFLFNSVVENCLDPSWMKHKHLEIKIFFQDAAQFIRRDQDQGPAVSL